MRNIVGRSTKKAARGRSMEARPTQSRKRVKGGLRPFSSVPCRVQGQRPCWGLVQRPNCSAGDQYVKRAQQKCRQRSVPASNFARPQTRPKLLFPQNSVKTLLSAYKKTAGRNCSAGFFDTADFYPLITPRPAPSSRRQPSGSPQCSHPRRNRLPWRTRAPPNPPWRRCSP